MKITLELSHNHNSVYLLCVYILSHNQFGYKILGLSSQASASFVALIGSVVPDSSSIVRSPDSSSIVRSVLGLVGCGTKTMLWLH